MSQFAERPPDQRPVVLGYDGSQTSRRALVRAAKAAGPGGRVIVVTAVPPGEVAASSGKPESAIEPSGLLEDAAVRLSGYGVDVSTELDEAEPVEALAAAARKADAQLIVVGARGESYVARALRGSVGERLVSRSPCDLLVVR